MKVATHYDLALSVAHLWDMPDITREYLETQNPELRTRALWFSGAHNGYALVTSKEWKSRREAAASAAHAAAWGDTEGIPRTVRLSYCMTIWAVVNALGLENDYIADIIKGCL